MEGMSSNARLLATLWRTTTCISKKVDTKLSLHGINFTEFLAMLYLAGQKEKQARRIDLAEYIGVTASGITRMLAPMEKIGLVQKEKNARDARVSIVKLTESGERILAEALVSIHEVADRIFAGFHPEESDNIQNKLVALLSTT